ncbi:MAG: cation-translocating P-type ATPase [Nanoarchaeota archaeon]
MDNREFAVGVREVCEACQVDAAYGLSEEEVRIRLQKHGENSIETSKGPNWFRSLIKQCKSFILYVLLVAVVLSFIQGHMIEVYVISAIIFFIVGLGFFMEYKASKDMEALKKLTPVNTKVRREGKEQIIPKEELVPGDIVLLKRGDIVPADARVISAVHLHVDESMLTGESTEVVKSHEAINRLDIPIAEQSNMLFGGTHITNGHGVALILRTGRSTEMGKISDMLDNVMEKESPLQKRIDKLGKQISVLVVFVCLGLFPILLFRGAGVEATFLLIIALAVSGVPESLPAVIGVSLALGIKTMIGKNVIVKQMSAVETLGTCTVICTDKTGTLTQNKMVVEKVFLAQKELTVTGSGVDPAGEILHNDKPVHMKMEKDFSKFVDVAYLCNNAKLYQEADEWRLDGESTEGSLMVLAKKAGVDESHFKDAEKVHELAFDPVRKCMSTITSIDGKKEVQIKGAPEIIIGKAKKYLKNGKAVKLDEGMKKLLLEKNHEYASLGLRVLALGYKKYRKKSFTAHDVESDIIFVGLVAIRDPPAEGVQDAIRTAHEAGMKVVMITGDNSVTALAIARELRIYEDGDKIMTGQELDSISDEELHHIIADISVFARTTPSHKLRIVKILQERENVVAMTGDGVNDSPALKQADIGVAMGKRGTEVAKEAANMVILDDNFSTIVEAVREGRIIYSNIRKFIYYILGISFAEISLIVLASLFGINMPLSAIMILFINLVTADLLALAIIKEAGAPWIMQQKPRDPSEGILNEYLLLRITQVVPIIALGTFSLFIFELWSKNDLAYAQTVAFTALILFELFHAFNARSFVRSNFHNEIKGNILFFVGIVSVVIVLMLSIYWPPMQAVFGTVPLAISEWIKLLIVTPIILLFVESQKAIIASEFKERKRSQIPRSF